jgi:transcriptional regulator with XRE-family HTH domain
LTLGRQFGNELRGYRQQTGLTTAWVADALDCTIGKISRIENGRVPLRSPDLAVPLRIYGMGNEQLVYERPISLARTANRRRKEGW